MDNEKKNTIEENFKALDGIIDSMKDENVTLDKSFELYKTGIDLINDCNAQIDKMQREIEILEKEVVNDIDDKSDPENSGV